MKTTRLFQVTRSAGFRHGLIMTGSTLIAGGLDYLFNILTGRLLEPIAYSILISVLAILQIMLHATNVIRNIVAYYTAEIAVEGQGTIAQISRFLQRSHRWAWRWGIVATLIMALLSPTLARMLQIPTPHPLWAASLALLMLFVRPVTDGTLQGAQHFGQLAAVSMFQSILRLTFALVLIHWGWEAFGAILALPLATASAYVLALWFLRPYLRPAPEATQDRQVSWQYSAHTLLGLLTFALLVNLDAIVVKALFSPETAGNYAPVITLGKINLFIPLAIGMVLFPKAIQRHNTGRDARPILLAALLAALLPGLGLTSIFFLIPDLLTRTIFGDAYASLGIVVGLVGLATTLYAGINIWLNYALSVKRPLFIYTLVFVLALQTGSMFFLADDLTTIASIMVAGGFLGNLAGALFTLRIR
ncbi:MAG: hypothetical protein H6660_06815 [Ardenticatenaceae bacterium]|nr:hypothetical protein [Ardenticatenaceae bacterium]